MDITTMLYSPWPWYIAGPLIGLMVPMMLIIGNRSFGISISHRHICAMVQPPQVQVPFFKYDWRPYAWCLLFVMGIAIGGYLAGVVFVNSQPVALSEKAQAMFVSWGIALPTAGQFLPHELYGLNLRNFTLLFTGGVFAGFGTRYAGGCTSGHAITGLSTLQLQSLYAVLGIFSGGLLASWLITPELF